MTPTQSNLSDVELPAELADSFASVSTEHEQVKTLVEVLDIIESLVSKGDKIMLEQFYQSEQTRHKINFTDTTEYVPCALDTLIVARRVCKKVESITSRPPTESNSVVFWYQDGDLVADPEDFVMSLGLSTTAGGDSTVESQDEFSSMGEVDLCGYINAFSSREEYKYWQTTLTNGTVMMLNGQTAIDLAAMAASRWEFKSSS